MVEPEPRAASTPAPSAPGDEPRVDVTREVAPEPGPSVIPSVMPTDLSAAVGASELLDPLLAAVAAAPTPPPPPSELLPGAHIGGTFRIERRLGAGGMGVVYLAHDESLDRLVAVKLHKAGAGADRLQREAMAMARLTHPNVITVHEVGRLDDRVFVAMEYVPGGTLRAWLKARPRTWREALSVCLAAGDGLAAAHDAGLVHRDFKPENVLVGDDGRARVGDFGLARAIGDGVDSIPPGLPRMATAPASAPASASGAVTAPGRPGPNAVVVAEPIDAQAETVELDDPPPLSPAAPLMSPAPSPTPATPRTGSGRSHRGILSDRLTMTGVLVGTPAYMAPEQFAGAAVDAQADQFAFAVMTWEVLYGKRPFGGSTADKLRAAVEAGRLTPPPRDTQVPARVRAVLTRALAVAPAARWPSMHALLAALRTAARPSRRPLVAAGVGVAALAAAGVAWAAWPRAVIDPCAGAIPAVDAILPPRTVQQMVAIVTGAGGDRQLLDRLRARLETLAPEVHVAALAVCRAGKVTHSLSPELHERSLACLAMRTRATAIMIDDAALATSDPAAYATRLHALPPLTPCGDASALAASAPRKDEPAIQARALLWAAGGDVRADRFAPAMAAVRRALAIAAPDDRGARALATMVEGRIAYAEDRLAESARLLTDAYYAGVALDDTGVYLEALQYLVQLHANDRFEPAAAEPWLRAGAAAIERDRRRAIDGVVPLLRALVGAADRRGDSAQAVAWGEQLMAILPPNVNAAGRAEAELALAEALAGAGRADDAIAHYRAAIDGFATTFGPTHPKTAQVLTDFGLALLDGGKYDEAGEVAKKARIALAAWPTSRSSERATALLNLGVLLTDHPADFPEAERAYREARATFAKLFGPEHPDVALCDANLAVLENKRGNHAAAVAVLERALAIQEKAFGPDHFQVASTVYNIAAAAILAGDFVRGEAAAARAEAMFTRLRPDSALQIFAMTRRARALSGLGHHAAALELARRAEALARKGEEGEGGISALVEMARAQIGLGVELDEADAYLAAAHEQYSKFPDAYAVSLADVVALRAALARRKPR